MSTDMVRGYRAKMELCDDHFNIDTETLNEVLKPFINKRVATGCPYCNPDNYEPYWLYDLEYVIAEDDMIGLSMVYDDSNNKFSLRASGDGEVTVEINFCPFCGRKLVEE